MGLIDLPQLQVRLTTQYISGDVIRQQFDRPIKSPTVLIEVIERAQLVLTRSQMTVLEYEPRQLIPVRLQHIGRLGDGDAAELEELE